MTVTLNRAGPRASLVLAFTLCAGTVDGAQERHFTVRDSVAMAYFGTVSESTPSHSYDDGSVSPNGRYFIKMTHRGVLPAGELEGTIWLFESADIAHSLEKLEVNPPGARPLVRISAAANGYTSDFYERGNILFQLMWSHDSRYVYFLGRDGQENRRLFRVSVPEGNLETLSQADQDVMTYRLAGDSVAYLAGPDVDSQREWVSAGSGIADDVVGTGTPLMELLYPNFRGYAVSRPIKLEVWTVDGRTPRPVLDLKSAETLHVTVDFASVGASAQTDGSHTILADELFDDADWKPRRASGKKPDSPIRLFVRESLNLPPVLVAEDTETRRSRIIFDPNPQLADILMAEVRVFRWTDVHGQPVIGGLVTPPGWQAGKRYPLVIQTHGFDRERFFTVGYSETANAGRALAGRGIVVLQVAEPTLEANEPWRDLPKRGIESYLAAIDALVEDKIVDPARVGISGYSETGLLATAALSYAPDRFAAALIANSDPLTFTGYNSYVDSPIAGVTERLLGAYPYGEGLSDWLDKSPAMSADKIRAPVLIFASDPWHLLGVWDLYATLRYQDKPVELHYIRTGQHNLKKPRHRLSHQEMLVDWFDFWLNADNATSALQPDRFDRWTEMKRKLH